MFYKVIIFTVKLSVVVAIIIVAVALFNKWLKHKERAWAFQLKQDNNKALAPLRISAYERIVVMLERISPQSLVMRYNPGTTSAAFLQMELIKAIREEYEHNVSLQMYVSPECWERVKRAKDETAELVKVAFTKVRPEAGAMDLSREILKLEATVGNGALKDALTAVRLEMARYF